MAELEALFEGVDALLIPTCKRTAPFLEEKYTGGTDLTYLPSFCGVPAISIPAGVDAQRLPIGLQLVGAAFSEGRLLTLAHFLETARLSAASSATG